MLPFALLAALVWGICVALFIRLTEIGSFIAERLTWLSVVIGTGGNFLILLLLVDHAWRIAWWEMAAVFALSGLPLCAQGVWELAGYFRTMMDANKNKAS